MGLLYKLCTVLTSALAAATAIQQLVRAIIKLIS